MHDRMPFGKYKGTSVPTLALTDYPYLAYICDSFNIRKDSLRREIEVVRHALNHFTPKAACIVCKAPATILSIAYSDGHALVEDAYHFCADPERDCKNRTGLDGPRDIVSIKFDSMLRYSNGSEREPKQYVKRLQELMNQLAGFSGPRTQKRCDRFLDELIAKDINS